MTENNEEKTQKRKWYKYKKGVIEEVLQTGFSSTGLNQAKAKKYIKRYFILGCLMTIGILIFSGFVLGYLNPINPIFAASLILNIILLVGIYRKAKWAAITFLAVYLLQVVVELITSYESASISMLFMRFLFALVFFQGTMAIIKWPKLKDEQEKTV